MINYLSNLARLAYKGWSPQDKTTKIDKLKQRISEYTLIDKKHIKVYQIDDLLYYTIETENKVYIGIRGTNNFKNWIRDISFFKVKLHNGKVHRGFYDGAMKIFKSINSDYRNIKHKEFYIGGHSMGSGITMILVNLLFEDFYNVKVGNGIGCPRVGDKKYIKNTSKYPFKRYQICNHMDIVPNLPLWIQGYRHYSMLYINSKGLLVKYNTFYSTLNQLKDKWRVWEELQDHDSNLYCQLLSENVGKLKELEK